MLKDVTPSVDHLTQTTNQRLPIGGTAEREGPRTYSNRDSKVLMSQVDCRQEVLVTEAAFTIPMIAFASLNRLEEMT
jgi:hypothetical protein